MLGLHTQLATDGEKIIPAEKYGVQVVSMGFLTGDDAPVIWRGPMLHGAIQQFFREVRWDDLDYLIVDMPPGTGDVALSLSQTVPVSGAIVVTTPQTVSLADTRRAVRDVSEAEHPDARADREHEPLRVPELPATRATSSASGGGEALAQDLEIPFLGRMPIYEPIRDRRRYRRADRDWRAGVAGRAGVPGGRRAGWRRRCRLPATQEADSADAGQIGVRSKVQVSVRSDAGQVKSLTVR